VTTLQKPVPTERCSYEAGAYHFGPLDRMGKAARQSRLFGENSTKDLAERTRPMDLPMESEGDGVVPPIQCLQRTVAQNKHLWSQLGRSTRMLSGRRWSWREDGSCRG
jgi:hypothetical protein